MSFQVARVDQERTVGDSEKFEENSLIEDKSDPQYESCELPS